MKKIILILGIIGLFVVNNSAFSDEIIDSKGNITPCKIVTVGEGLIEYQKDGCLNTFCRDMNQPVFNDYVDVRTTLISRHEVITRYCGTIIMKDFSGVKINTQSGVMTIPWYRVKFVGIYKP